MSDIENILNIASSQNKRRPVKACQWKRASLTLSPWGRAELLWVMSAGNILDPLTPLHTGIETHSSCFTPCAPVQMPTNWRMASLVFGCVVSTVQCCAAGEVQYAHTIKLPVNNSDYYCWDPPFPFSLLSKSQFQVGLRFPKPLSWT